MMQNNKSRFFSKNEAATELSDVAHIEDWAARLESWLQGKARNPQYHANFFRPDIGAEKAMMNLEDKHPTLIKQISKMVEFCEADLRAVKSGNRHVDDLADDMWELFQTLNNAIASIKKADGKTDGKKNNGKSLPKNPDAVRLIVAIENGLSPGVKRIEKAREITNGDEIAAKTITRKAREYLNSSKK
jgi:hypothetical protein